VSWSAGDALLVLLAAMGALRLLQTLLFALHLSSQELSLALFRIGAAGLLLGVAAIGVRRSGERDVEAALGIRVPQFLDWVMGIALGIGLYFATISMQEFINEHFAYWVSWYAATGPYVLERGPWILLDLVGLFTIPVAEESLFRGFLHRGLRTKYPIVTGVVLSASLFAVYHVNPAIMPAIFVDGVVFALAFEWRRTLAMPMVIHSTIIACFLIRELLG
jgi:hypothetical protein